MIGAVLAVALALLQAQSPTLAATPWAIQVSWNPYVSTGGQAFQLKLQRNVSNGAYVGLVNLATTATSYVDASVQHNRTYCYRLIAVGLSGLQSAASTPACSAI